jgi:uncharacterized protein YxjI
MRYLVKQRIFSFGDSYTIKDEAGNDRFIVKGEVFTLGHKLTILDTIGTELIYIEQELFHFRPTFNIYEKGNYVATVKKEISFFTASFSIESTWGNYTIEGQIFSHEFSILRNGVGIAQVSKEWFTFSDSYGIEIEDNENQEFILSLVIVLDEILYSNNKD